MKQGILLLFTAFFLAGSTSAQLKVFEKTKDQIVQDLVGPGVTVSNVTFKGNAKDPVIGPAIGWFDGKNSNLGMDQGAVLTTGTIYDAPGPNSRDNRKPKGWSHTVTSLPGDPDLNAIINCDPGSKPCTQDASILEFDFVPESDVIRFEFIFASDEYHNFTCTPTFYDLMGFFLSGPGITGPYSKNSKNLAVIPGTNKHVSINTINDGEPGMIPFTGNPCDFINYPSSFYNCDRPEVDKTNINLFIDNGYGAADDADKVGLNNCPMVTNPSRQIVPNGKTVQYNGFTVPLVAQAKVIPCETYHIKIAIADVGDGHHESAVFLKDFRSDKVNVTAAAPSAVEGCDDIKINFELSYPAKNDTTISFTVKGSATNGVDYNAIPSSVTIPKGQTKTTITIPVTNDGQSEGTEQLIIQYDRSTCASDELIVELNDPGNLSVNATGGDVCANNYVELTAEGVGGGGVYNYTWYDANNQVVGTGEQISVKVSSSTTYTVKATDQCGNPEASDQAQVNVITKPKDLNVTFPKAEIFEGCFNYQTDKIKFELAQVSNTNTTIVYTMGGTATHLKDFGGGLKTNGVTAIKAGDKSVELSLWATLDQLTEGDEDLYIVYQANDCTKDSLKIVIKDNQPVNLTTNKPISICGGSATLEATASGGTGNFIYIWKNENGATVGTGPTLKVSPSQTTTYTVEVKDLGCDASKVAASEDMIVNVSGGSGMTSAIGSVKNADCQGNGGEITVSVTGGTTPIKYEWNDPGKQTTATATGLTPGTYTVTITDGSGCSSQQTATVNGTPSFTVNVEKTTANGCDRLGGNNGSASVSVTGGASPFVYEWDDAGNQTTATAAGLAAGKYTVKVTDANNCVNTVTVEIVDRIILDFTVDASPTCPSCADGKATVNVSGTGTPPYTYRWNDDSQQTTKTATGLKPGKYVVTVFDDEDCYTRDTIEIGIVGIDEIIDLSEEVNLYPNPNNGKFFIKFGKVPAQYFQLKIVTVGGQSVFEKQFRSGQDMVEPLNTGGLAEGLYFMHLTSSKVTVIRKILIRN